MKKETRLQLLKRKRDEIIYALYYDEGFLIEEITKIFGLSVGRVWQIIQKVKDKNENQ